MDKNPINVKNKNNGSMVNKKTNHLTVEEKLYHSIIMYLVV